MFIVDGVLMMPRLEIFFWATLRIYLHLVNTILICQLICLSIPYLTWREMPFFSL